jgi:cell division septal protein FtsQ
VRKSSGRKATGKKRATGRRARAGSHVRFSWWNGFPAAAGGWFRRPQNAVFLSIFVVICFTFPPLLRYIQGHHYFAVSEVVVSGTERLEESRVQRWMGVVVGRSIWNASPRALAAELTRQSAIESAEVRRLLPNRLQVSIVETPARALLRSGSDFYLVGAEGEILDPVERPSAELPIVSLDAGAMPTRTELREALVVVALFEEGEGGIAVSEIEIEHSGETRSLVAHATNGRLTVRLGWGNWRERLAALGRVVADASGQKAGEGFLETGHLAGTVDVLDAETVVARWRPGGGAV